MREIKFRVWDKKNKRIISAYADVKLMSLSGTLYSIKESINGPDYFEMEYSELYELMQFTGLKDKNGGEIYEGDIVKHKQGLVGAISWSKTGSCFIMEGNFLSHHISQICEVIEVIGNIYDNPELLEGKE